MKSITSKFKYILLMLLVVFSISCSPEDGVDGIDGIDGAQGIQGPAGLDGQDGQDGQDGNANVIVSSWLDANWNESNTGTSKVMRITPEEIGVSNNTLRDHALVMIYLKQYGSSSIYTLDSSGRWGNTWYSFTFGNNLSDFNGIRIRLESTNGVALTEYQHAGFRGNRFRYVIIPENGAGKHALDFEKMSYEDVMDHLNQTY